MYPHADLYGSCW